MSNEFTMYIKVLRANANIPIGILAKLTGFSRKYLLDLETGKTPPTEEVIEKLILAYNLDIHQQRILYNTAATATNSLPLDVVKFLRENPNELAKVIDSMHHYHERKNHKNR